MSFLIRWLLTTLSLGLTALILPGAEISGFFAALLAALVLGLVNVFIKPFLQAITMPLNVLTLGLFTFVLNALLIWLVSVFVPGFRIRSFGWAILFAIVFVISNYFIHWITGTGYMSL